MVSCAASDSGVRKAPLAASKKSGWRRLKVRATSIRARGL